MGTAPGVVGAVANHLGWMRLRGLRETTVIQRRRTLGRLRRALGHDLLTASREELTGWQRELKLSSVSMAAEIMHVACFYRWAFDEGLIGSDPAARLPRPRVTRGQPRPISAQSLQVALEFAPRDVRLMLVLAAYAGLRAGEMARLQRSSILDGDDPPGVTVDGKGGKQRWVPLSSRVLMELQWYGMPSRGPLFPRRDGRPGGMTPGRVSQMCNKYLHSLGIADTLHAGRHFFGTHCHGQTPDLRLLMELMGHSSPTTTALYVKNRNVKAAAAVEALAQMDMPNEDGAAVPVVAGGRQRRTAPRSPVGRTWGGSRHLSRDASRADYSRKPPHVTRNVGNDGAVFCFSPEMTAPGEKSLAAHDALRVVRGRA